MTDTTRKVAIKSMCSAAADAYCTIEIQWQEKTVTVSMATARGKPFFSDAALRHVVADLLRETGIDLWDRDSDTVTGRPHRSDWAVIARIGEERFQVRLIDQPHLKTNTLELWPTSE